jgi:hypothetical protein
MKDPIILALEIAQKNYEEGHITLEQLVDFTQKAINAVAKCNGYEEKYGLPFPEKPL